ncbi:MAG: tol-pal system YbgF family protein [Candidatus Methylacidiphilales bacterium]
MIRFYLLLIGLLIGLHVTAQYQFNYSFLKSLINQKEPDLALSYLNNSLQKNENAPQIDSIYYFKGLLFYEKKQFDSSINSLQNISTSSPIFIHAAFTKLTSQIYANKPSFEIEKTINSITNNDATVQQMKTMMVASYAMITNNIQLYDSTIHQIKDSLFIYNSLQTTLYRYRLNNKKHTKSGFVAGALSAAVPGLGKVYAGKYFDGLSTFFTHVPLAFILNESYQKTGLNSGRFITFSVITSMFYFGNILTSYHYIKLARKEVYFERKNEILLHCNIMLRNYFN